MEFCILPLSAAIKATLKVMALYLRCIKQGLKIVGDSKYSIAAHRMISSSSTI